MSSKSQAISVTESIEIAEKYLEFCPNKEYVKEKIEYRKKSLKFEQICEKKLYAIRTVLENKFGDIEKGVYVFGTGVWGIKISSLLKKNEVPIISFIDSNREKWETEWEGRQINNPELLKHINGDVIIAVKNSLDIIVQLEKLYNKNLRWLTLEELIEQVVLGE